MVSGGTQTVKKAKGRKKKPEAEKPKNPGGNPLWRAGGKSGAFGRTRKRSGGNPSEGGPRAPAGSGWEGGKLGEADRKTGLGKKGERQRPLVSIPAGKRPPQKAEAGPRGGGVLKKGQEGGRKREGTRGGSGPSMAAGIGGKGFKQTQGRKKRGKGGIRGCFSPFPLGGPGGPGKLGRWVGRPGGGGGGPGEGVGHRSEVGPAPPP